MHATGIAAGMLGILMGGLFVGARSAILVLDHDEIRARAQQGEAWASRTLSLLEHPERVFATSRLGVELSLLGSGTLITVSTWGAWGWMALYLAGLLLCFLLLSESLPHAVVARRPLKWIRILTRILTVGRWALIPWIAFQRVLAGLGPEGEKGEGYGEGSLVSRQALAWLIRDEEDLPEVRAEERKMIDRIFQFSDTQVREVMIPLIDVCAVEEKAAVADVIRLVKEEGYSRLPVYRERIDHILGIVRSFDLLAASSLENPVTPFVRKVPFVPESMPVDELMLHLQREGHHMAIAVDEYGGGVGIVTMEDLLEEIVGEIMDEYDVQEAQFRRLTSNQWVVNARMEVDQFNEVLGLRIPQEDYETLGGFLLKGFRRIPREGESLIFRGVQFTVQRADDRSVKEVLVTLPKGEGQRGPRA